MRSGLDGQHNTLAPSTALTIIAFGVIVAGLVYGRQFLLPLALAIFLWNLMEAMVQGFSSVEIAHFRAPRWLATTARRSPRRAVSESRRVADRSAKPSRPLDLASLNSGAGNHSITTNVIARTRDPRSYAQAFLGLRMIDDTPALEVLETLA